MKIGILTFHDTHNFGACLQAYALSEVLRRWGHEVEFINYHNDYLGSSQVIPVVSFLHYVRNPKLFIKASNNGNILFSFSANIFTFSSLLIPP